MNYWEIGYAAFAAITLIILFVQVMVFASREAHGGSSAIAVTVFLALILAVAVSLIWPIAHVLLLCGMVSGGMKRRVEVKS